MRVIAASSSLAAVKHSHRELAKGSRDKHPAEGGGKEPNECHSELVVHNAGSRWAVV